VKKITPTAPCRKTGYATNAIRRVTFPATVRMAQCVTTAELMVILRENARNHPKRVKKETSKIVTTVKKMGISLAIAQMP